MGRRPAVRSPRRDDEGQIILPLVVFVMVMFVVALGLFGFGEASDSRGDAQKGADAAALGAAASTRDAAILALPAAYGPLRAGSVEGWIALGQAAGCPSGLSWAARNQTTATCAYQGGGQFHTTARSRPSAERKLVGEAEATADMNLPTCTATAVYSQAGETLTVVCAGSRGGTATVIYQNGVITTAPVKQVWQNIFRVRLVA
jgi:Flp pilus assembly protein TadG